MHVVIVSWPLFYQSEVVQLQGSESQVVFEPSLTFIFSHNQPDLLCELGFLSFSDVKEKHLLIRGYERASSIVDGIIRKTGQYRARDSSKLSAFITGEGSMMLEIGP
ncbi:hypothetical protein TNIN_492241 [Trichonephila inaurata madagascariensis]|uniref:Uncharacterized protein n=1 Tax=Trichonephila inaurata madagascariensis TaxID=2747483 RepID=A0A8X6K3V6_9ARAC|nr:hypothetical protein TNIN_492241 [Trichonephila inaurata madagascariensis]